MKSPQSHPSAKKGKRLPGVFGNYVTTPKSASTMPSEPPPPKGWTRVTVDSAKKAKARVMSCHSATLSISERNDNGTAWSFYKGAAQYGNHSTVLVLPMPTLKAARARMRWENMTQEAKVEALALGLFLMHAPANSVEIWKACAHIRTEHNNPHMQRAKRLLRVIEGE